MNASTEIIQVKSLIRQLLEDCNLFQKTHTEDIICLNNFLEDKASVSDTIKVIQKIRKIKTG